MNNYQEIEEENQDMPSLNHSLLQARLVRLIDERFIPLTELSLEVSSLDELSLKSLGVSKELKPDLCLYSSEDPDIYFIDASEQDDLIRVAKMPLLIIEITSPMQGNREILTKVRAYFALGTKSCWVVDPSLKIIAVYRSPSQFHVYQITDSELVDEILDIRLPMTKIFARRLP